ncbi:MAG: Asp-tRNA(Asn)/Glu-tRNA(Gln) amidotransferase subunit GatB [Candidatus Nealsonbacteria bacterium]|nr:Asp-tRNA(Asn)/Glu-tRNA(Gln) amidotransferase subunit GatB [Candidatus Nealsonbacteria bacterium]
MEYKPVIGLEIHAELRTKSKMFCACLNDPDEKRPNLNICPICLGHPGTLPVINQRAVEKVIKVGSALNCKITEKSKFDRKNYFYPDLPKGYQISQYDKPLCEQGFLKIGDRKIRITRVHLEEDTGKLIHPPGADYSLVDFNRAGVPLMELVTEPDIHSAKEATDFAQELRLILRYLQVSEANMEKGQLRVEANISVSSQEGKLGTKVEVKNLNSFKVVQKSIEHEIKRQSEALRAGQKIIQETRGWMEKEERTVSQRIKEEAHDYRYFPEPDLPAFNFTTEQIEDIKNGIPELPQAKRERLVREYELDKQSVEFFVQNKDLGEYFEQVVSEFGPNLKPKDLSELIRLATNYLMTDVQAMLKSTDEMEEEFLITAENFAEFIVMIKQGKISSKTAKNILVEMFETGADPSHIVDEKGLEQIQDQGEIEPIIQEVIANNPQAVDDYKEGKKEALQFLIGKTMAKTRGKANPEMVRKTLQELLS